MLVLGRRQGEAVIIAGTVRVTVEHISPGKVRLGFEAPPDVVIHREEVYQEIQDELRRQQQQGGR